MAGATQFKVGGSFGWSVPAPNTVSYNQWAQANRFKIGDSLVFTYPQGNDSVLVVDQDGYNTCKTSSYIKKFDDGNSVFTFDRSGPFFFISGIEDNCMKKESLVVIVLANRTSKIDSQPSSSPPSMSPIDSPVETPPPPGELTAPPPTANDSVPVLPPSGEEPNPNPSTAPPPSEETNTNPTTQSVAPSGEENPNSQAPPSPSGASLKIVGLIGSTGPLLGHPMHKQMQNIQIKINPTETSKNQTLINKVLPLTLNKIFYVDMTSR
ncbi:Early nodulin-like protein 1 [Rhynchospora pubera]|uniref:Early nodulin-like protein 1 n=1 Tax=Rhynchospora pubera TaxID=906938 RepID=A0AAV8GXG9_9POAL|nr:Early nodulin-like protein 1 [Rhynchospora pubera]